MQWDRMRKKGPSFFVQSSFFGKAARRQNSLDFKETYTMFFCPCPAGDGHTSIEQMTGLFHGPSESFYVPHELLCSQHEVKNNAHGMPGRLSRLSV